MSNLVLLTSPDQARPIVSEYLAALYRRTDPTEELHVLLPDGRYAEIFPAYCDDGGLLQVDFFDGPERDDLVESQNVDKIRGKRNFARDFSSQVEFVMEVLAINPRTPDFVRKDSVGRVIAWAVANAYVGELWREDSPAPVTFRAERYARAYADAEMARLDLDRYESLVVRYLFRA